MYRIAYVSTATVEFSDEDLRTLLTHSRVSNSKLDITGSLLYRGGRFIQILEGPEDVVRRVFAHIGTDPRHADIHVGASQPVEARQFANWTMGYRPLKDAQLERIVGYVDLADSPAPTPGVSQPGNADDHAETLFDWLYEYWLGLDPAPAGASIEPEASRRPHLEEGTVGSSSVVTAIFDAIMADVQDGSLLPGDRVSDQSLAKRLGTSRTPVREALQRLRELGVVEASASRFTRIAVIDADTAAESIVVFAALYSAVLNEVIDRVGEPAREGMRADRVAVLGAMTSGDRMKVTAGATRFYLRLVAESTNEALRRAVHSVIPVIALAGPHVEPTVSAASLVESMELLLDAVVTGSHTKAQRALVLVTAPAASVD